jgi:flagellar basal-body rod protein FlgC
MVVFEAKTGRDGFRRAMARASTGMVPSGQAAGGVRVTQIVEDPSPMKLVYDPSHPDANEDGYVEMPNVDMVKEIADAMAASQAYSANVTMFNTVKTVVSDGLQIGK